MTDHEDLAGPEARRRRFGTPLLVGLAGFLLLYVERVVGAPVALQAATAVAMPVAFFGAMLLAALRMPREDPRRRGLFVAAVVGGVPVVAAFATFFLRFGGTR
jgi:hypothetical protein